jgi:hypothetical protein
MLVSVEQLFSTKVAILARSSLQEPSSGERCVARYFAILMPIVHDALQCHVASPCFFLSFIRFASDCLLLMGMGQMVSFSSTSMEKVHQSRKTCQLEDVRCILQVCAYSLQHRCHAMYSV